MVMKGNQEYRGSWFRQLKALLRFRGIQKWSEKLWLLLNILLAADISTEMNVLKAGEIAFEFDEVLEYPAFPSWMLQPCAMLIKEHEKPMGCYGIAYAPSSPSTDSLMQSVQASFAPLVALSGDEFAKQGVSYDVVGFETEEAMVAAYEDRENHPLLWGGIVFANSSVVDGNLVNYTIRVNQSLLYGGNLLDSTQGGPTPQLLQFSGYQFLQQALMNALASVYGGNVTLPTASPSGLGELQLTFEQFPTAAGSLEFPVNAAMMWPIYWMMPFVVLWMFTAFKLTSEKVEGRFSLLQIHGMYDSAFWAAWFVTEVLMCMILAGIFQMLLVGTDLVSRASGSLIFITLLLYALTHITCAFLMGVLSNNAKSAAGFTFLLLLVGILLHFLVENVLLDEDYELVRSYVFSLGWEHVLQAGLAHLLSLLPTTPLGQISLWIAEEEYSEASGAGAAWSKISTQPRKSYSASHALIWLACDSVIYVVLAWYFRNILQTGGGGGKPKKWYFLFTREYWSTPAAGSVGDQEDADAFIKIENLRKVFHAENSEDAAVVAVDNLSISVNKGKILALLGPNGAGKSTTVSCLSGKEYATSGNMWLCGMDASNASSVRGLLGVCPQDNVLWKALSAKEHLMLFGAMKGVAQDIMEEEIDKVLKEVMLDDVGKRKAGQFSGGMQRKLSLAIALFGNVRVLLLDEPTAGLDPASTARILDVLESRKSKCAMVLTTHHMEEADQLGDHVAIMQNGKLTAYGTSMELKKKYGIGYKVFVSKEANFDEAGLTELVKHHFQLSKISERTSTSVMIRVPPDEVDGFPAFFPKLEEAKNSLGISNVAVSHATLDELFSRLSVEHDKAVLATKSSSDEEEDEVEMKVVVGENAIPVTDQGGEEEDDVKDEKKKEDVEPEKKNEGGEVEKVTQGSYPGNPSPGPFAWYQIFAIFQRRWRSARRSFRYLIGGALIPLLFGTGVIWFHIFRNFAIPDFDPPPATMTPVSMSRAFEGEGCFIPLFNGTYIPLVPRIVDPETDEVVSERVVLPITNTTLLPYAMELLGGDLVNCSELSRYVPVEGVADEAALRVFLQQWANGESKPRAWMPEQGTQTLMVLGPGSSMFGWAYATVMFNSSEEISMLSVGQQVLALGQRWLDVRGAGLKLEEWFHPLPSDADPQAARIIAEIGGVMGAMGLTFMLPVFAMEMVQERGQLRRHLLQAHSLRLSAYWVANALFDLLFYVIVSLLVMGVIFAAGVPEYLDSSFGLMFVAYFTFGCSLLSLSYVASMPFRSHESAAKWLFPITFVGFVVAFGLFTMAPMMTGEEPSDLMKTSQTLIPPFAFYLLLQEILMATGRGDPLSVSDLGDWDLVGKYFWPLLIMLPIFVLVTMLVDSLRLKRRDWHLFKKPRGGDVSESVDVDRGDAAVGAERKRTETLNKLEKQGILIRDIRKFFPPTQAEGHPKWAVRTFSLQVPQGECFGLLGPNGAGKTTLINCVTGRCKPNAGNAFLDGQDVVHSLDWHGHLGLCLQEDVLYSELTPREHLELFARVHGVEYPKEAATEMLRMVDLAEYADRQVSQLSGGCKRRLSLGQALIGEPTVVFLDEPSSSLDPIARQSMWRLIKRIRGRNRSILLTTHSLQEAEALCSRLAIMVDGQLRVLGTPQQLKTAYGQVYNLSVLSETPELGKSVVERMTKAFPDLTCHDGNTENVKIEIPQKSMKLGTAFQELLALRAMEGVRDFSVSQTSLEQVFMQLVREQEAIEGERMQLEAKRPPVSLFRRLRWMAGLG